MVDKVLEAARDVKRALDFHDLVVMSSEDDRIAVGQDHWTWLLASASKCRKAISDYDTPGVSGKPHRGSLGRWRRMECENGLGYYIVGIFIGHPSFTGEYGHTSYVVAHEGDEIETRNSRYTLVGEEHVIS